MGPRRLLGDEGLARSAADGDERAFARIYERHHQGLYRYCRSILRNDEDAADALQNTMLKALRALPGESRSIALKPWLYRIAHNEAISLLRRRTDGPIEDVAEVADAREVDGATRERLRTLLADLAQLPERQRGALVMRELSGLSYDEIGTAFDSSPAAAKQSVYEAREALHQLAEGRAMDCDAAHRLISANDRRILRGRKLRAHLRSCDGCRGFERALNTRGADLALLAPPLASPAAAALLEGIVGGGGGGWTGGGLLGVLTGAAGNTAAGSAALKATTAAVTVAVGIGAYEAADHVGKGSSAGGSPASSSSGSVAEPADAGGGGSSAAAGDGGVGAASTAGTAKGDRGGASAGGDGSRSQSGSQPSGHGGKSPALTPPGHGGSPPGLADKGGGPPGLGGGAPPGQGGSPPGLGGGAPPGQGGTPPGQGGTPPGLGGGTPPAHGGAPPGLTATPPGQGGTPPGQGGAPPGAGKPG